MCFENKGKDFYFYFEMEFDSEFVKFKLKLFLMMSNCEFKEKFGYVLGFWRGKKLI